jgi:steroid 5-alpha reductase family enzyme
MSEPLESTHHHGRTGQRHGIAVGEGEIRRIFPLFVILMWVTTGFLVSQGVWTSTNWLLAGVAAVCTLIVFVNFALVFSVGYTSAVAALNVLVLVLVGAPPAALLVGGLLVVYALRLGTFVVRRMRHESYAGRAAGLRAAHTSVPLPIKILLWVQTTTLFTFHAFATWTLASADAGIGAPVLVGAALLVLGIGIEATADAQKQRHKRSGEPGWVRTGLWSRSRHPNYLGEILVQLGVLVSALGVAEGVWGVLAVVLAPTYIAILMLSATTGGEQAAAQRYGDDEDFADHVARTGLLLPRLR